MNIEEVREYALTLPHTTEDIPYGPDCVVFRIAGKIFLHIALESSPARIAIKLRPEFGESLREQYEFVRPAFHMNKVHWNDVFVENTVDDAFIKEWIRQSYDIVYSKLPRRTKEQLT